MDTKAALQVFHSLIEQVVGIGGFKTLADLDHVRTAHKVLFETINNPPNEKTT